MSLSFPEAVRLFFLGFYAVSLLVLAVQVLPAAVRAESGEHHPRDARRYLPAVMLPVAFIVPPVMIFFRIGEIDAEWPAVRMLGVLLSMYSIALLPWSAATLGRFLVPQAVVFQDHALVTRGPYRFVRHPAYAGDLALWLASGLGTLNAMLVLLWPLYLLGVSAEARVEEELLEAKFGLEYQNYARRTGRFVPSLWSPRP